MYTIEDFDEVIVNWCSRSHDPGHIAQESAALRAIYIAYIGIGDADSVEAIMKLLGCLPDEASLLNFFTAAPALNIVRVKLHKMGSLSREAIEIGFFKLINEVASSGLLRDIFSQLMRIRNTRCAGDIGNALSSAIMNVTKNLLMDEDIRELLSRSNVVAVRLRMLCDFLEQIMEYNMLSGYEWVLTGSDPHCHGKQVILLKRAGGAFEMVYKPRSMSTEILLYAQTIGRDNYGLFELLNRLLEDKQIEGVRFPRLAVQSFVNTVSGLIQYVQRAATLTPEQVKLHYRILGALLFVSKLFGLSDLHQDNFITTLNGPVIIDAECAFIPNIIDKRGFDEIQMYGAIHVSPNAFNEASDISFKVVGGIDINEIRTAFQQGFILMKQLCSIAVNKTLLRSFYIFALTSRPYIRIVPISTTDLAGDLTGYWDGHQDTAVNGVYEDLTGVSHLTLDEQNSKNAIRDAFESGDIPSLQISVSLGSASQFFINGRHAGTSSLYSDREALEQKFNDNLEWLISLEPIDLPQISEDLLSRII